jgi:hypothetical protein
MSDRQLNDLWYSWLRIDPSVSIEQGYTWDYSFPDTMAAGADVDVTMRTATRAVSLIGGAFTTTGTRGATIDFYVGGDIQLPTPIQGFPANHERPKDAPFAEYGLDGFLATPGTLMARLSIDTPGRTPFDIGLLLRPSTLYYMTLTNIDNQSADISLDIRAGSVGAMIR